MKKLVFLISTLAILLTSCESKLEKLTKEVAKEYEEYIEAYDNAQSIEEFHQIRNDYKRRGDYWEREAEKILPEISITEKQRIMQDEYYNSLRDRYKEAERNAYRRLK